MAPVTLAVHTLAFALGVLVLVASGASALRSTVLPGPEAPVLSTMVLRHLRRLLARYGEEASGGDAWPGALIPALHLVASLTLWLSGVVVGSILLLFGTGQAPLGQVGDLAGPGMVRLLGGQEHSPTAVTAIQLAEIALGAVIASAVLAVLPAWQRRHRRRDQVVTEVAWRTDGTFSGLRLATMLSTTESRAEREATLRRFAAWLDDVRRTHSTTPTLAWLESTTGGPGAWVDALGAVVEAAELLAHYGSAQVQDTAAEECFSSGVRCLRTLVGAIALDRDRDPAPEAPGQSSRRSAPPWRADVETLRRTVLLLPPTLRHDVAA
jgi:hypothetical protein